MKLISNFLIITLLPLLFLLTACSEEIPGPSREYHRINTNQVSNIRTTSATLSAEISYAGPEPILDHGFTWGKTRPYIDMQSSNVISLGSKSGTGGFSTIIEYSFEPATTYYVRPFVRTETSIVYGNMVSFVVKF